MRTTIGVTSDGKELYSYNHSHLVVPGAKGTKAILKVWVDGVPHSHEIIEGKAKTTVVNGHFHKIHLKPKRTGF